MSQLKNIDSLLARFPTLPAVQIQRNSFIEGTDELGQVTASFGPRQSFKLVLVHDKWQKPCSLRLFWELPSVIRQRLQQCGMRINTAMEIKRLTEMREDEADGLVDFGMELCDEVTSDLECFIKAADSSQMSPEVTLYRIEDLLLRAQSLIRKRIFEYASSELDFLRHSDVLANLRFCPSDLLVESEVDYNRKVISLSVPQLLTPITPVFLSDYEKRAILLPRLVDAFEQLWRYNVLPSERYFYFKPLSMRVVVVPGACTEAEGQMYLDAFLQTHWADLTALSEDPVRLFSTVDYENPNALFGEVEAMKDIDVREHQGKTVWKLRIRCISHFHLLVWKHRQSLSRRENMGGSSSFSRTSELREAEVEAAAEFRGLSTDEMEMVDAYGSFRRSESTLVVRKGLIPPWKLSYAAGRQHPDSTIAYETPILLEDRYFAFFAKEIDLALIEKLDGPLQALHEKGYFHGLLTPATIRKDSSGECYLSLAALDWMSVPLLYRAIPPHYLHHIAFEVKTLAVSLQQPASDVDFMKADAYSVASLIAEYGEEACSQAPELAILVKLGLKEDWRLRPTCREIIEALQRVQMQGR